MNREYWANFILCIFLAILAMFAITKVGTALTPKGLLVSDPTPSNDAAPLLNDVQLSQFSIVKEGARSVASDFYIRNNSNRDVKNVNILCEFYDENKTYLDREKWILYHTFPQGVEKKVSQVSERYINVKGPVECRITDLHPVEEPIFKLHRSTGGHGESQHDSGGHDDTHHESGDNAVHRADH